MNLPSIAVTEQELDVRTGKIAKGMLLKEVRAAVGGVHFKRQRRKGHTAYFWRFLLSNGGSGDPYRVYLAEVSRGRIVRGYLLPVV